MKHLLSKCPECKAVFYEEVKDASNSITITCPYCDFLYEDILENERIKETSFYWELYRNLYKSSNRKYSNHRFVKYIGLIMLSMAPVFLIPLINIFYPSPIISLVSEDASVTFGFALSGIVFFGFYFTGILSFLKCYSFAMASTGAFFGILNSFLWLTYYSYTPFSTGFFKEYSLLWMVPAIISFICLIGGIYNRWIFKIS